MDTKILLNLIDDLLNEDAKNDINTKLVELMSLISQSRQSNSPNTDTIDILIKGIEEICSKSFVNSITKSQLKIFTAINGDEFFGSDFDYVIKDIFSDNQYNLQKLIDELQKLLTERKAYIEKLTLIKENLNELGIESHYFTDEIYEIGVIIPDKKNLHTTDFLEKHIHNWNFVFKTLCEVTGKDIVDTKIDRVSEGCIELFFQQVFDVAEAVGTAMTKIAMIYLTIRQIKTHRESLKDLKVPSAETKIIEEHEKKLIDNAIEEATDEIIKKHSKKIDANRKNELKTAVNKSIRFIARSIDNGIEIEIIPPYLSDNEGEEILETDNTDTKKIKEQKAVEKKKKEERIEVIKKSGNVLKDISEIGGDVLKLLTGGDDKLEK